MRALASATSFVPKLGTPSCLALATPPEPPALADPVQDLLVPRDSRVDIVTAYLDVNKKGHVCSLPLREAGPDLKVCSLCWPEASSTSSLREPPRAGSPPRDEASHPVLGPWVSQAPLTASSSGVGLTAPMPAAHRCRLLWEVRLLFWLSDTTPRATSPGQGQPDSPQGLDTDC